MERVKLNVGDTAWVYERGHQGERTPREIVHVFELWGTRRYVVAIPTHIDTLLDLRDELSVSDAPDRPIGLWRGLGQWLGLTTPPATPNADVRPNGSATSSNGGT